jgi:hypothetical protein
MSISDFVIVYLSLGAPAAVCHFFEDRGRSGAKTWLTTLAVFLVWPPKTIQLLRRQVRKSPANKHFGRSSELDSAISIKQKAILDSIKTFGTAREMFELRDILEGYVTLTRAADETTCEIGEIFRVAGRINPEIGTLCLNRRNAARLARHQTDAGRSLIAAVEHAASSRMFPLSTVGTAVELAGLLGDTATEKGLREIERRQNIWTEPVGESWKSEPNHTAIEQSAIQFTATTTAASAND